MSTEPSLIDGIPIQDIPLQDIELDPLNPNEMESSQIFELQDDIQKHGFIEPVTLIRHPNKPGKYRCVAGEHRIRAMRTLRRLSIPSVVREWTEEEAAVYLVRHNVLRGTLNRSRLRELVNERLSGVSVAELAKRMAFRKEQDLAAALANVGSGSGSARAEAFEEASDSSTGAKKEISALRSLGDVVSKLYAECGDTVNSDYLAFCLDSHTHFLVVMDQELFHMMSLLCQEASSSGKSIVDLLKEALRSSGEYSV